MMSGLETCVVARGGCNTAASARPTMPSGSSRMMTWPLKTSLQCEQSQLPSLCAPSTSAVPHPPTYTDTLQLSHRIIERPVTAHSCPLCPFHSQLYGGPFPPKSSHITIPRFTSRAALHCASSPAAPNHLHLLVNHVHSLLIYWNHMHARTTTSGRKADKYAVVLCHAIGPGVQILISSSFAPAGSCTS